MTRLSPARRDIKPVTASLTRNSASNSSRGGGGGRGCGRASAADWAARLGLLAAGFAIHVLYGGLLAASGPGGGDRRQIAPSEDDVASTGRALPRPLRPGQGRSAADAAPGTFLEERRGADEEEDEFSVETFVVAGVDLAQFRRGGTNVAAAAADPDVPPFRLYREFDLRAENLRGDESWRDLVRLRRSSADSDLSFYVDKVAQKRWLPTRSVSGVSDADGEGKGGEKVDIPRPFALRYASELTENRSDQVEERAKAIRGLLPDVAAAAGGYAAKPSHQTYCDGARVVAFDSDSSEGGAGGGASVRVARNKKDLAPAEGGPDAVGDEVSRRLAEYLAYPPRETQDSNALRGVKPGVVVEERFVSPPYDDGDGDAGLPEAATEFKVVCVWGRAVFATWQRGTRTPLGTVARDGTVAPLAAGGGEGAGGASGRKLPRWVDWDRVVRLAEGLSAHKDMYRVDVFVGVPAGSEAASVAAETTEEERRASVRYVVSETEIAPSTSDKAADPTAWAEAARLWVAGYKMLSYKRTSNDEVPRYFHVNGMMPERPIEFNVPAFVVGGVDLAQYERRRDGRAKKKAKAGILKKEKGAAPFELFEDFDIRDQIQGNEGWWDLTAYRKELERPSLRFYMDKICQKRWLPTIGVDIPGALLLRYGRELSPERKREEEKAEMLRLLPKDRDYAAKPSHTSYSDGVRLVRYDRSTGRMAVSQNRRTLEPVPPGEEEKYREGISGRLAEYLHLRPRSDDSWTLFHVEPGVVVEERFTLWDRGDSTPAIEFKVFNVWGRVVFALWRRGNERPGIVHRNGTLADWSEKSEDALPPWLNWTRVVDLSEKLAANKDMYRVDVFVGIAAGADALQPGTSEEERIGAVRYAVSETEIYPTTTVDEQVFAEAARLWVAGYKAGNFKAVKNTEVDRVFLEKGYMPMTEGAS